MSDLPPTPPAGGRLRRWGAPGAALPAEPPPADAAPARVPAPAGPPALPAASPWGAAYAAAPPAPPAGEAAPEPAAPAAAPVGPGLAAAPRPAAAPPPASPGAAATAGRPGGAAPPVLLRDHRILTFSPALLCAALHHAGRGQMRLPPEEVTAAELLPEEQSVRFRFGPQGRAGEAVVTAPGLGATLIAYCIGTGIPMPAQAAKSLKVTDLGVVLELRLVLTSPPFFRPRNAAEW